MTRFFHHGNGFFPMDSVQCVNYLTKNHEICTHDDMEVMQVMIGHGLHVLLKGEYIHKFEKMCSDIDLFRYMELMRSERDSMNPLERTDSSDEDEEESFDDLLGEDGFDEDEDKYCETDEPPVSVQYDKSVDRAFYE